jgi:hypothetical protein
MPITLALLVVVGCNSERGFGNNLDGNTATSSVPAPSDLPAGQQEDVFVQATSPKSDVLFVIDNSGSMEGEQDLLARNFPRFMDWFLDSGVDYHIGVVTTDMYDRAQTGLLRSSDGIRWLDPETPNPQTHFVDMAAVGIDGANDERGRAAAYTAIELRARTDNAGFLRDEASLHLVAVTDEEDESGRDPITRREFISYLQFLKDPPARTTFSSIVGPDESGNDCDAEPGTDYLEITRAVGGVERSICSDDWGSVLDELGFLAVGYRRDFYLSRTPAPGTLEVLVQTDASEVSMPEPSPEWTYRADVNAVSFDGTYLPPSSSVIRIRYEYASR